MPRMFGSVVPKTSSMMSPGEKVWELLNVNVAVALPEAKLIVPMELPFLLIVMEQLPAGVARFLKADPASPEARDTDVRPDGMMCLSRLSPVPGGVVLPPPMSNVIAYG